jgi:hypothetical protein
MEAQLIVIYIGALLVIGGVLFLAYEAIWGGRLSGANRRSTIVERTTLEPKDRSVAFDLRANWPGFVLIALGAILLLAGAAFL